MKRINFLVFAMLMVLSLPTFAAESTIPAKPDTDLSEAVVDYIFPQQVLPGTMLTVVGRNFGRKPGVVYFGNTEINQFLGWTKTAIFFRVPENIERESQVKVGDSMSAIIKLAPPTSIKITWKVDQKQAQAKISRLYQKWGLAKAPRIKAPFYIKGEWVKSQEDNFGAYAADWDTGELGVASRVQMCKLRGTSIWMSESVFTPKALSTFADRMMMFAIEDSNLTDRNLSSFESDASFIIKKDWAATDAYNEPIEYTRNPAVELIPNAADVTYPVK